ncbi:MAG: helix-turn-helix domain-containing protein [Oscillospiraceae bacterium]|jgi:transcriptional regulator with XRE-family HTH domain|nr:helix-turn-helix domain-containing protein [Oscillospiraceae bacterium]
MPENTLAERLKRIIAELGMSKATFARSVGVTRNYIYYLTGGRKHSCSRSLAMLIEQKYGYPAEWLLTGRESDEALTKEIAQKVKALDPETLRSVSEYLDKLKGNNEK